MFQRISILIVLIVVMFFAIKEPNNSQNNLNQNIVETVATSSENNISIEPIEVISTSTPEVKAVSKPKTITEEKPKVITPVTEQKIPESTPDFEKINNFSRGATVNILCMTKNSGFSPISGTGIIINKEGLILTNAHVAQYYLLKDLYTKDFIDCAIRTGSPAYPRYKSELVFISPAWVKNNKDEIVKEIQMGNGENDYALIKITEAIDNTPLPYFSYLPINTRENISEEENVVLVSYPAGFLGGLSIIQNLYITSAITKIQNLFTYGANTVDVVAVGGTIVSQKGASGGAVVDENSSLIGIITTSTLDESTNQRELNAITLAYINRQIKKETNYDLNDFVSKDISSFINDFKNSTAPELTKLLTQKINDSE